MKKKLIIGASAVGAVLGIPLAVVYAQEGIDGFQAYVKALEFGLLGLGEYFGFIIELFEVVY